LSVTVPTKVVAEAAWPMKLRFENARRPRRRKQEMNALFMLLDPPTSDLLHRISELKKAAAASSSPL
jgi:hypothetical protein